MVMLMYAGLGTAVSSPSGPAVPSPPLAVPFVEQDPKLCGGACLAMTFRYWGERGVRAADFARDIDTDAGISVEHMAQAAARHGYEVHAFEGSVELLRRHVSHGRPLIVLLDVPGPTLHYVVVIAVENDVVTCHDPALRPDVTISAREFARQWSGAHHWTLLVTPRQTIPAAQKTAGARLIASGNVPDSQRWTAAAQRSFRERQWSDAEDAAAQALAHDDHNEAAWHLLGASQYMLERHDVALGAWNRVDAPEIDLVQVRGLDHTRHAAITRALSLESGDVLTRSSLELARRRLDLVPAVVAGRVDYRPVGTEIAQVDVAVVERARWSPQPSEIGVAGVRALSERRVMASLSSPTGHGEVLDASYRWWEQRPRAELALSTPDFFGLQGRTRIGAALETQTYATHSPADLNDTFTETTREGSISWAQWLQPAWMIDATSGFHYIRERGRYASYGGGLTRAVGDDHVRVRAGALVWDRVDVGERNHVRVDVGVRTRLDFSPAVQLTARAGWSTVDAAAPRLLWPGAGTGEGRPELLRAHPLLEGGVIDGDAFAPSLASAGAELTRWFGGGVLGAALFVDTARPLTAPASSQFISDAGIGLRVHPPGHRGHFRLDFATGLSAKAHAFSLAWLPAD